MANLHMGTAGRQAANDARAVALFELLERRWALRVLWELRAGAIGFRNLQLACGGVSPTVLSKRLSELRGAGLVEAKSPGFVLTDPGEALVRALQPLGAFAQGWQRKAGKRRA
jgi:DNA-binding HxlR family transcriptional regulator